MTQQHIGYGSKRAAGKTREMVLRYAQLGLTQAEIARLCGVSRENVRRHMDKLRDEGLLEEKSA